MESQEQGESVTDLDNFFHISLDGASRDHLKQIALWARICSITGLLGYVIQLYEWLFGHSRLGASFGGGILGSIFGISSIGGGAVVNYFLYRFAVSVSRGVQNTDADRVNSGFNSLRLYFRTAGILVIIIICLVFLGVIGYMLTDRRVDY
ncbi:MAG TPA: hypothetical protein VFE32_12450 [Puia sp.]|nr:hypothetical protein [Puia sp.]